MHEGANREQVLYVCWSSMYVCSKSTMGVDVLYVEHVCMYVLTYIHTKLVHDLRPHAYNLTWRIVDRGRAFIDLRSLDKLTCSKPPLPVVLFCYLRFKIFFCMLSKHVCMYVNVSKTLSLWRVFKSPLPVEGFWLRSLYVCMLSMYVCMLGHLEVPPLTNLKKLNYRSNTERFS